MLYLDDILLAFGGSAQTIPYAKDCLRIVIPGSVLSNLSYSFSGVMRATGYPRKSMYTILIGVGLNVILDPIFIFGLNMGIEGAAVATVISMFVSMLFVMSHFFNTKHQVHFRVGCFRPKARIIRNIVSIGMAPFLMNLAASVVNIIMNNQLVREGGGPGDRSIRHHQQLGMLIVMCVLGLCQGMQPIVGFNYGAGKHKRVKDIAAADDPDRHADRYGRFPRFRTVSPRWLVRAFTDDPDLTAMAVHGMRLGYCLLFLDGFQIVVSVFLQSISKAQKAVFMGLSRQVIFLIPALYFFSRWFGLTECGYRSRPPTCWRAVVAILFLRSERRVFLSFFRPTGMIVARPKIRKRFLNTSITWKSSMYNRARKWPPTEFHITVMEEGPYLVYGQPPLKQQFMLPNREGEIWYYKAGKSMRYPRRTDGAEPLRRVEDQAVLRRFARAYRLDRRLPHRKNRCWMKPSRSAVRKWR